MSTNSSEGGWTAAVSQTMQTPGIVRGMNFVRLMASKFAWLSIFIGMLQIALPHGYRPSDLIGSFYGNIENYDITVKRESVVELARQQAEATAREQALASIEVEAARQQQQEIYDSQTTKGSLANGADLLCMLSHIIPSDANSDWQSVGSGMRSACGVGDQIRSDMVESSARAARQGSSVFRRTEPAPAR